MRTLGHFIPLPILCPLLLAGCAGAPMLYPQPYIGKTAPVATTPQSMSEFQARRIRKPAPGKAGDLAEAYIAAQIEHPSSAKFTGLFESVGKSPAICGFVTYKGRDGGMTAWRPFVVEWTTKNAKGEKAPYGYDAEAELAKLCGPMIPPPGG